MHGPVRHARILRRRVLRARAMLTTRLYFDLSLDVGPARVKYYFVP